MISQKDIAAALKMPLSTVGNILNGTPHYNAEKRERVLKVAKEMGYQRNRASLAVKRGRSNLIALIHFGIAYETARQAAVQMAETIGKAGYDFIMVDLELHSGNAERALTEVIQSRAEGALLLGDSPQLFSPKCHKMLERARIPVVSYNGEGDCGIPMIGNDIASSFYAMTRHLQEVGHRCLLHPMLMAKNALSVQDRLRGFEKAVRERGDFFLLSQEEFNQQWPRLRREYREKPVGVAVELELPILNMELAQAYQDLMLRVFRAGAWPDAVVCVNDIAACGVFNAAHLARIRIPEEIAVTGADNDRIGDFPMFNLTSIQMDIPRSATTAVEMLLQLIRKEPLSARVVEHPSRLVLRQSCGRMVGVDEEGPLFKPVSPL